LSVSPPEALLAGGRVRVPARTWAQAAVLAALLGLAWGRMLATLWNTWATNDNYSHGPLVPVTSLALVWLRWDKLRALPVAPDGRGLWLVAAGCAVHLVGVRSDVFAAQEWSLLLTVFGLVLTFLGVPIVRMLAFPIAYLGFMFTFPPVVMNTLNFGLKELAVSASTTGARALGATFERQGMQIFFPTGELRVEAPCSGLRSLIALLATGTLFAYFQRGGVWRRVAMMACAVPIALAGNVARLLLLLLAADRRGVSWAAGGFHDLTGYVMYVVALALLLMMRVVLTPRRTSEAPR
jgi:exosortase